MSYNTNAQSLHNSGNINQQGLRPMPNIFPQKQGQNVRPQYTQQQSQQKYPNQQQYQNVRPLRPLNPSQTPFQKSGQTLQASAQSSFRPYAGNSQFAKPQGPMSFNSNNTVGNSGFANNTDSGFNNGMGVTNNMVSNDSNHRSNNLNQFYEQSSTNVNTYPANTNQVKGSMNIQNTNPNNVGFPSNEAPTEGFNTFIGGIAGNPAAQIGVELGNKAFQHMQQNVNQNISRWVDYSHLKGYFNVSTSYVFNKIRLLLFPYTHKSWTRLVKRSPQSGQMEGHRPPREDLNAPDLYIPLMSLITYVLLIGLQLGLKDAGNLSGNKDNLLNGVKTPVVAPLAKSFSPDVLGMTFSSAIAFMVVEVLILLFSLYMMSVHSNTLILDLVSYSGYKYIGIIFTVLAKIFTLPRWAIGSIFFYCMISLGFFTIRTLKYILLPENINPINPSARQRRIHFLFIVSLLQIFISWILVGYI